MPTRKILITESHTKVELDEFTEDDFLAGTPHYNGMGLQLISLIQWYNQGYNIAYGTEKFNTAIKLSSRRFLTF